MQKNVNVLSREWGPWGGDDSATSHPWCVCVFVYKCVCGSLCMSAHEIQRLMLNVFISYSTLVLDRKYVWSSLIHWLNNKGLPISTSSALTL